MNKAAATAKATAIAAAAVAAVTTLAHFMDYRRNGNWNVDFEAVPVPEYQVVNETCIKLFGCAGASFYNAYRGEATTENSSKKN